MTLYQWSAVKVSQLASALLGRRIKEEASNYEGCIAIRHHTCRVEFLSTALASGCCCNVM